MTRQSTALLTVGPRSIAPWGDTNRWIVAGTAQLVEGNIPYWLVSPTEPAQYKVSKVEVTVEVPFPEAVVESILLLLSTWFGDHDVFDILIDTHNATEEKGERAIAPYFELSNLTVRTLSAKLSDRVRLGFTLLDEFCLVDDVVIQSLRDLGFTVDVFRLAQQSTDAVR